MRLKVCNHTFLNISFLKSVISSIFKTIFLNISKSVTSLIMIINISSSVPKFLAIRKAFSPCPISRYVSLLKIKSKVISPSKNRTEDIHVARNEIVSRIFFIFFLQILCTRVLGNGSVDFYESFRYDRCWPEPKWKYYILMTSFLL